MRINEQSPKGVAGLRMLFEESEQSTPCSISQFASATPRRTLWSWSRPIKNRSVAGKTVTAIPALAKSRASGATRSGGKSDSLAM